MLAGRTNIILDLCSGGGGPWPTLAPALAQALPTDSPVRIVLSDQYPNVRAFFAVREATGVTVEFFPDPIDATRVPVALPGVRTMFNAFHHFSSAQARAVIAGAVAAARPIAIFEASSSRVSGLLVMPLQIPAIFILTPFVRPFRWSRLLFTYVIPLIPLLVLFDGAVSFMRLYGPDELRDIILTVPGHEGFNWEIGSLRATGMPWRIGYFVGTLKK